MNLVDTTPGKALLNEAAFTLIAEQAADELPQYVALRDHYLADPNDYLLAHALQNRPLEFGGTEVLQYLTIAVFPLLNNLFGWLIDHTATKLAEATGEAAGKEATTQAIELLRSLFARKPDPKPLFTAEELRAIARQLNQIADHEAAELGLNRQDVVIIRDMVIGRLALALRS